MCALIQHKINFYNTSSGDEKENPEFNDRSNTCRANIEFTYMQHEVLVKAAKKIWLAILQNSTKHDALLIRPRIINL